MKVTTSSLLSAAAFLLLAVVPDSVALADEATCGSLENAFGPFDYRDPQARGEPLHLVEIGHFTRDVENLVKGTTGPLTGDLDYTLRAFPNHHKALYASARYVLRGGKGFSRSIECYFDRAIRFAPDDAMVYLVQGIYFSQAKRPEESIRSYRRAISIQPDLAEAHYNLGLALLEAGNVDAANDHAQTAYRLGYPLPGLRSRLQKAGAWKVRAEAAPAAAGPTP